MAKTEIGDKHESKSFEKRFNVKNKTKGTENKNGYQLGTNYS